MTKKYKYILILNTKGMYGYTQDESDEDEFKVDSAKEIDGVLYSNLDNDLCKLVGIFDTFEEAKTAAENCEIYKVIIGDKDGEYDYF